MNYLRQSDLLNQQRISSLAVSIIGCGAIGSTTAMALAKMGVGDFTLFDEDGVNEVNLPNQMFRESDINKFKVEALALIILEYSRLSIVKTENKNYTDQPLSEVVIVATDSMSSRRLVWEQFLKQPQCQIYIEARMGAEEGQVYTITDKSEENQVFYLDRLYTDDQAKPAPCTAKAIIYNVFMIAALVGRAFKAAIHREAFPREVVMGMKQIHKYSFQIRD